MMNSIEILEKIIHPIFAWSEDPEPISKIEEGDDRADHDSEPEPKEEPKEDAEESSEE